MLDKNKLKLLAIPIDPNLTKENVFDQTYKELLPKLQGTEKIPGIFYVENFKFGNNSYYKGQMLI